jgi:hypothetical protein
MKSQTASRCTEQQVVRFSGDWTDRLYMAVYGRSAGKSRRVVGKSRCPKCGRNSLVREKDGWEGAKPRIVCAYVGCREVVSK